MALIEYTAKRSLVAGHVANTRYALAIGFVSALQSSKDLCEVAQADSGEMEPTFERQDISWRLQTQPVAGDQLLQLQEFLDSTESGETFRVWVWEEDAVPLLLKRLEDGHTEASFMRLGAREKDCFYAEFSGLQIGPQGTHGGGGGSGGYDGGSTEIYAPEVGGPDGGLGVGSAPTPNTPPTIFGTPSVGEELTGIPGSWSGSNLSFTYEWWRTDGDAVDAPIGGATGLSYVVQAEDAGFYIYLVETATNAAGSASAASDPTDEVGGPPERTEYINVTMVVTRSGSRPSAGLGPYLEVDLRMDGDGQLDALVTLGQTSSGSPGGAPIGVTVNVSGSIETDAGSAPVSLTNPNTINHLQFPVDLSALTWASGLPAGRYKLRQSGASGWASAMHAGTPPNLLLRTGAPVGNVSLSTVRLHHAEQLDGTYASLWNHLGGSEASVGGQIVDPPTGTNPPFENALSLRSQSAGWVSTGNIMFGATISNTVIVDVLDSMNDDEVVDSIPITFSVQFTGG